ncbi:MAG: hypothetical protein OEZ10_10250 [Gammaproteobacteria bacterium]|nr:hypothetical protein [Gammaproteobacteria bacterium]
MHKYADLFQTILLVALSGNMAIVASDRIEYSLVLGFAYFLFQFLKRRENRIEVRPMIVITLFSILLIIQYVLVPESLILSSSGFILKLCIAYLAIIVIKDFPLKYVHAIFFLSIISLFIFTVDLGFQNIGIDIRPYFIWMSEIIAVEDYGVQSRINIGIHNFQTGDNIDRNAGFFWEPGAYSGYIILALIFLSACRDRVTAKSFWTMFLILVLALFSTKSTTGLVIFPLVVVLLLNVGSGTKRNIYINVLAISILISVSVVMFGVIFSMDFVGDKLQELYGRAFYQEAGWHLSRFGSVMFDWDHILVHPFVGWGFGSVEHYTMYTDLTRYEVGNGASGFVRQTGFLGAAIYVIFAYIGLLSIFRKTWKAIYSMSLVILTLNGEYFLSYPIFLALMFLNNQKYYPIQRGNYSSRSNLVMRKGEGR